MDFRKLMNSEEYDLLRTNCMRDNKEELKLNTQSQ